MNKFIAPIILTILIAALLLAFFDNVNLLPAQATVEAKSVDGLFHLEFQLISMIFALCLGFLLYSIVTFRRKPGEEGEGQHFEGNVTLEAVWTLIPTAIVLVLGFYTATQLNNTTMADDNEVPIHVNGIQWSWLFTYPMYKEVGTVSELVLLKDQPIRLVITSESAVTPVIHSFWVPEFRMKQDAVPGVTSVLHFTPDTVGDYRVVCAELCGTGHAKMVAPVHVLEQTDYDAWLVAHGVVMGTNSEAQTSAGTEATAEATTEASTSATTDNSAAIAAGATLYTTHACIGCHKADENGTQTVGPSWIGLFGSEVTLSDGTTVTADEAYLRESILDPSAKVVEGFPDGVMPHTFADTLSEEDVNNLIAYIESLSGN